MFRAVRLRLIGYVTAVLLLMLLATGGLVYALLTHQLDAAVDAQLGAATARLAVGGFVLAGPGAIVPLADAAASAAAPGVPALGPPAPTAAGETMAAPFTGTTAAAPLEGSFFILNFSPFASPAADVAAQYVNLPTKGLTMQAAASGEPALVKLPADTTGIFASQWLAGHPEAGRGALPAELQDLPLQVSAAPGRDDLRTVSVHGRRYRLLTREMPGPPGQPPLLTQTGVSLGPRDRQEKIVLVALGGGGLLGIALAAAGVLFLTGRALVPLQLAFDRQRRFVGDASHELRTPLALIRLEAEDLARRLDRTAESRPLLRQVDRTSRLVDDLLTLARLDQGVLQPERESVYVPSLIEAAAIAARRLAAQGVTVTASSAPGLWTAGDSGRLHQVLLILVDNACRATPPGGRVELHAARDDDAIELSVADTGPGIPPEHAARIFERFYRVDKSRARSAGGAGLGLAIARELVAAHGGTIALASPLGCGAVLTVRLPVAPVPLQLDADDLPAAAVI